MDSYTWWGATVRNRRLQRQGLIRSCSREAGWHCRARPSANIALLESLLRQSFTFSFADFSSFSVNDGQFCLSGSGSFSLLKYFNSAIVNNGTNSDHAHDHPRCQQWTYGRSQLASDNSSVGHAKNFNLAVLVSTAKWPNLFPANISGYTVC